MFPDVFRHPLAGTMFPSKRSAQSRYQTSTRMQRVATEGSSTSTSVLMSLVAVAVAEDQKYDNAQQATTDENGRCHERHGSLIAAQPGFAVCRHQCGLVGVTQIGGLKQGVDRLAGLDPPMFLLVDGGDIALRLPALRLESGFDDLEGDLIAA